MGLNNWNHVQHLHHKVRNVLRRGYLLKTYYDKKLMQARFKTGERIENDKIDIMHPVGFLGRVAPGDKVEVFSMDVGGDPSRRVVLGVLGDRATHPKIDEGESILYSPGDPKKYIRVRKGKKKDGAGGGGQQFGVDEGVEPQKEEEKKEGAIETDADDVVITSQTKKTNQRNADEGQGFSTKKGSVEIKAGANTQFEAAKHLRKGETHREGSVFVSGTVNAGDVLAGGGTSISSTMAEGDDKPDGSKPWSASGKPGTASLLETAAKVGTLGTAMSGMVSVMIEMAKRIQALEQGQQPPPILPEPKEGGT